MKNNSPKVEKPASRRYGAALVFTAIALGFTLIVEPRLDLNVFNLFLGAVFFSAWYGGLGPGLTATFLSIAAMSYFFIPPRFSFSFSWVDGGVDLLVFGILTFVISSLSGRLREAKAGLERAQEGLEQRIRERTEQLSQANAQLSLEVANRLEAEKAILQISQREQERMGRDLHDGLCQTLAGLRLVAETLNNQLSLSARPEKEYIDKIERLLSQALTQADSISRGLYPVELESRGFMAALQELAHNASSIYSINCRMVSRQPILLESAAVATHLFRIAQEAVMNAIKSGKARNITLRLFHWNDRALMAVVDDGIGFDPPAMRKGMGLRIMDYRARIINASFKLRTRKKGGTLALCSLSIPLPETVKNA